MIYGECLTELAMSFPQQSGQGGDYDIQIHLKNHSNRSVQICSLATGYSDLKLVQGRVRSQESISSDEDREGLEYVSWRISINVEI